MLAALLLAVGQPGHAVDLDPKAAWQTIQSGAMLMDVRTPQEFAAGHLPNAVNIPFEKVAAELARRKVAKDTPVVLYCRSGRRSGIAEAALAEAGYRKLYNAGAYVLLAEEKPAADVPARLCNTSRAGEPC